MASRYERDIDGVFLESLVRCGYLRLGPSRAHVEFESVVLKHERLLMDSKAQREFADLCGGLGNTDSVSKIDYQSADDTRGHKLSIQLDYDDAVSILWTDDAREEFIDVAAAAVALVRDNVRRSPIRFVFQDLSLRSTVRAIVYMPGVHPGVRWHTDPCLLQFISIPAHDSALFISDKALVSCDEIETAASATLVAGGPTPETVLLPGAQAAALHAEATATVHAVRAIDSRRAVATHFVWLTEPGDSKSVARADAAPVTEAG